MRPLEADVDTLLIGVYTYRGFYIPSRMMEKLLEYINHGASVGHFLTAVLCNDLSEAVGRADDENLRNLPAYSTFLYNEAPSTCYGSKEKMEAWLERFRVVA